MSGHSSHLADTLISTLVDIDTVSPRGGLEAVVAQTLVGARLVAAAAAATHARVVPALVHIHAGCARLRG